MTRATVRFATATREYERFAEDVARGYRALGVVPNRVDDVARRELRWPR